MSRRLILWGWVVMLLATGMAAAENVVRIELGSLESASLSLSGVQLEIGAEGQPAAISIRELLADTYRWQNLRLQCAPLRLENGVIDCPHGSLTVPGIFESLAAGLRFSTATQTGTLNLRFGDDAVLKVDLLSDGQIHADMSNLPLARMLALLQPVTDLSAWGADGVLSGQARYQPGAHGGTLSFKGKLGGGRFSSADGLKAADGLGVNVDMDASSSNAGWQWRINTAWEEGEMYFHPLYLKTQASMEANGTFAGSRFVVDRAILKTEGVKALAIKGEYDLADKRLNHAQLALARADLAIIGPRFITPLVSPANADAFRYSGFISTAIEIEGDEPVAFMGVFDEAGFSFNGESLLSFGPVSGRVPWRAERATEASLTIGGGRWQKLALGAFELKGRLHGADIDLDNASIPILDGALTLTDLALHRDEYGWVGSGAVGIEPISVKLLTESLDLPSMSGTLAAVMPGMKIRPGSLTLEGVMAISVFDGVVKITKLQAIEPFGVASRLSADVDADHIDLAQLSETFSFGSVTGYVDAQVHDLELAQWQPVRFDAKISSSPGKYTKRISQRAVQNISALGGAGAVAAIQRGVLSFFDSFGYRRIGLSCKLENGVCVMDGLPGASGSTRRENSFLIIEGGGIPALSVIGYNRRMDWGELIDRLARVIESNSDPIIK